MDRSLDLAAARTHSRTLSHKHRQSPPPPIPSRRSSRFSFSLPGALPTPDLLSSIPSASHYVGAPPTGHPDRLAFGGKHRRSSSRTLDEPGALEGVYKDAMDDLKEMYCGRATLEILHRRWRQDAEFEDPLRICKGFEQYAAQWFALPRVFSHCEQTSMRILLANLDPNHLVFAHTMVYTIRFLGIKKTIDSIVIVDFDEDFKVVRLVDQWNGEQPPTRWGSLQFRKFNTKLLPWLIRGPKEKTS